MAEVPGLIGTVFERRFKVTAPLGEGNLGRSYRGTDLKSGDEVVVKLLGRSLASEPGARNRFQAAVAVQQTLSGWPDSPTLLAAQSEDKAGRGIPSYLIRAYVKGFSIREALGQTAPVPFDVTLEILSGLVSYLEKLEAQGFRHGSIAPENVILTEEGNLCVLDPGLGLPLLAPGTPLPPELEGRRPYFAPGYLEPPYFEDIRGDIYSLGRVVSDLAATTHGRLAREIEAQARRLEEQVLRRCVEDDPARRYASVAELKTALAAFLGAPAAAPASAGPVAAGAPSTALPQSEQEEAASVRRAAARIDALDHYELLEVGSDAPADAVQSAYYRLAVRYHPDRAQLPHLLGMRDELLALNRKLGEAYAALRDPLARAAYDERLAYARGAAREAPAIPPAPAVAPDEGAHAAAAPQPVAGAGAPPASAAAAPAADSSDPRRRELAVECFTKGKLAFECGDPHTAIGLLSQAVSMGGAPPAASLYLGLCKVRNPRWRDEATQHIEEALSADGLDGEALLHAARYFQEAGDNAERAKVLLRRALERSSAGAVRNEIEAALKAATRRGRSGSTAEVAPRRGLSRFFRRLSGSAEE